MCLHTDDIHTVGTLVNAGDRHWCSWTKNKTNAIICSQLHINWRFTMRKRATTTMTKIQKVKVGFLHHESCTTSQGGGRQTAPRSPALEQDWWEENSPTGTGGQWYGCCYLWETWQTHWGLRDSFCWSLPCIFGSFDKQVYKDAPSVLYSRLCFMCQ